MRRPLVFTNGCFDVLHRGHLELLREASHLGETLIVGLDSDESVCRLKGEGRPINPLVDRREMLLAYPFVDDVIPFSDQFGLYDLVQRLRPEVYVKGEDARTFVHDNWQRPHGGRVVYIPHRFKLSTTAILAALRGKPG